jgi:hypothetical protein
MSDQNLEAIDRSLLIAIAVTLIATVIIGFSDKMYFEAVFAAEDGLFEYGTAVFLFISSLVLGSHALSLLRRGAIVKTICTVLFALLFFFAAGEEISWGQRIFGWETTEFFAENNYQNETNLHNLMVGGNHLAKTLFGAGLTVVLLCYLVALPLLFGRWAWLDRLVNALAIPVPQKRHAVAALVSSVVIGLLEGQGIKRVWEIYEFTFSLMALGIFLVPRNRDKVV